MAARIHRAATWYLISTDRWEEIIPRLEEISDDGCPFYQAMLEKFQPILAARQANRGYSRDALYFHLDELVEVKLQ
ncbi:hypothetical protein GFY24_38955 [Nocardia sp. SYP-A9097]|nr:hypothetical protein [Nocardia sp. SYP-A9097]